MKVSGTLWRGDRSLHEGKVGIIIEQSWWDTARWEVFIEGNRWAFHTKELEDLNKSDKGENND